MTLRFWRTLVLAVAAPIAAAPAAAIAQTPTRDQPFPVIREARRWGPFLVDPAFAIENVGYDSNVFLVPEDYCRKFLADNPDATEAEKRGCALETDIIVRLGPEVTAQTRLGSRMALTLHDKLSGEVFFKHPDINHADNTIDAQFDALLGPVLLTTKGRQISAEDRPTSELVARTRRRESYGALTARVFLSSRVDAVATYEVTGQRYENPDVRYNLPGQADLVSISKALDRDTRRTSVEVGWRAAGRARIFLRWRERRDDFNTAETLRDSRDRRTEVGVEFSPKTFLTGSVVFGRSRLVNTATNGAFPGFDGTVSESSLSYRPTGAARVTLSYKRDAVFSVTENNLYFLTTVRGLDGQWYFGRRWGIQAGTSREVLDFPQPVFVTSGTQVIQIKREDRISNSYAGVLFKLIGGIEVGLRLGARKRDSNDPLAVDDQRYVQTTGSYKF